ncbi:hypothetical protein OEZ86_012501 [Tetradesmus obliquus]|nr:hypothetical protein OEZ86_012501 [Tetradesmus obliquus]
MQHPVLRKRQQKPPSSEAVAAADLKALVTEYSSRWEVQAACKGTTDAGAQLQAAKGLAALLSHVQQHHKATCRRAEVRQHFSQQLPPCLLIALLSSRSADAVSLSLDALLGVARLLPGLLPVQAAARLLELLCSNMHGAVAARLLTEQLTHWLFSQLWGPYWLAAGTTGQLYQHIAQQLLPALSGSNGRAAGAAAAAAALDACASQVTLLARLASLSEQQVVPQLAGDVADASRWLHLVLHRPCCTKEADDSSVSRWIHAAHAASLPVLWMEDAASLPAAAAAAAALEHDQLLCGYRIGVGSAQQL